MTTPHSSYHQSEEKNFMHVAFTLFSFSSFLIASHTLRPQNVLKNVYSCTEKESVPLT